MQHRIHSYLSVLLMLLIISSTSFAGPDDSLTKIGTLVLENHPTFTQITRIENNLVLSYKATYKNGGMELQHFFKPGTEFGKTEGKYTVGFSYLQALWFNAAFNEPTGSFYWQHYSS